MSSMLLAIALVAVLGVPSYVWGEALAKIAGLAPSAAFAGAMVIAVGVIRAVGYRRRRSVAAPSAGAEITEMLDDQSDSTGIYDSLGPSETQTTRSSR